MVRATEIAVVPERIPHRNIQITFRSPGTCMQTLMNVSIWNTPQQSFNRQSLPLDASTGQSIDRTDRDDVKIVPQDFNVIDP